MKQNNPRTVLAIVALASMMSLVGAEALASPCGTIGMSSGVVTTSHALVPMAKLDGPTSKCVADIGKLLAGQSGLRTVTITIRASAKMRSGKQAQAALDGYTAALVAGGAPKGRVSGVIAAGDKGEVVITFTLRKSRGGIATITAASGNVSAGSSASASAKVSVGKQLPAGSWIITQANARALVALADGSQIRVNPNTAIHIGRLHLDAKMKRVVELDVKHGTVEATVSSAKKGSTFRIGSRFGTAGVRGTVFRFGLTDTKTSLATLRGSVELGSKNGKVVVGANQGSWVDATGKPATPVQLPSAPVIVGPSRGANIGSGLVWKAVKGAVSYTVEVARDAEFVLDVSAKQVPATTMQVDEGLAAGMWFWRVSAVGSNGAAGAWSSVYRFNK